MILLECYIKQFYHIFDFPNYDMSDVITPSEYLIKAKEWKNLGAQIIGGCCGTTVDHIEVLKDL